MKIATECTKVVVISILSFLISLYVGKTFKVAYVISALSLVIFLFSLYFFRDPKREKTFKDDEISSPADGTVLSISDEGKDKLVIRIFLSVFNVHIQRSPVSGKIKEIKFFPGKFNIAYKHEAKDNQRNLIKIISENQKEIWVEQITGAIARRINCYVKENEIVKNGQKIGIIYFGSQVALYLPKDVKILIKPGDKLKAGIDIVAKW